MPRLHSTTSSVEDKILDLVDNAELFHCPAGRAYVTVREPDRSATF